ncbi:heme A synthase [Bartonella bacilliformis str. Heidi Mejia]|uniref:COX15/CtaA family protein n=1 Tax=Bartonella bacilliformis TaxID=774 RepID=UPI00044BA228|nr:COX15/CtaA family protein [Bartonella bacilliformis]EYS92101.1 heme A synthase [Bartonella bacilliformis str. Heidi Mejia]KEG16709.1 heme A synthase [Bartonella bacilliformis Cond044]KEG18828.1 heme A synthase [Bartonella bacilliformis Hosp800-02]KEG24285.1 heme A synthase [Bartonella bacilliformis CAR600-02]
MAIKKLNNITLTPLQKQNRKKIQVWLYTILLLCFAIVLVGGATRLTGSGLSITEWKPIHGVIPPIGINQWQEEFLKYQQIAQYKMLNRDMTLNAFKVIFWWEWGHRVLGRFVGLVALLGLVLFWVTKRIEKNIFLQLLTVPILIAMQGIIGWWMVASGLGQSNLTSVSQYRLAIHLIAACLVIIFVTYLSRGLAEYSEKPANQGVQHFAGWLVFLILVEIYFGALVAGLHAGKVYNTWPLMDGQILPDGLLNYDPVWLNFFENPLTVQFVHRCFSYFLFITAVIHALYVQKSVPHSAHAHRAIFLCIMIVIQAFLGIITLLHEVPISLGLIHQGGALVVLCFSVMHWRATKGAYRVVE